MFHEPTELLWIGCLTGLIWTPRSKFVTLTPNINSQTFWLKGMNFTRDEWNNLVHLIDISNFSSTSCTKNFSLISCSTMTKRIQDPKEEERVVSKSGPAAMNLSSFIATSSSTASSPIASKSRETASGENHIRMSINPNSFDAASTSQVRQKDAYIGGLMNTATEKPVASRRRKFRRLRQYWGWDLVLQRQTSYGETCCPKQ